MKKRIFLILFIFLMNISFVYSQSSSKNTVYLYFIRHGKTMFNTTSQVQGWADTPLTNVGIAQAESAGEGLKKTVFKTAYSSDLGRARSTANIILSKNQNRKPALIELSGLREWGYGGYEGRDDAELWTPLFVEKGVEFKADWSTWEEFTSVMSDEEIANAIAKNDPTQTAENYNDIVVRSKEAVEQIVRETLSKGGGNALIVSHGSEIPTILSIYVPEEYKGESIGNCSLTIIKVENGKYTLMKVGDTSYMK
jgi:broad specificity phosphatase PhoE